MVIRCLSYVSGCWRGMGGSKDGYHFSGWEFSEGEILLETRRF